MELSTAVLDGSAHPSRASTGPARVARTGASSWSRTLLRRLLGVHPHNTVFNYNWVIIRPLVAALRDLAPKVRGRMVDLGAGASPYFEIFRPSVDGFIALDYPAALPRRNTRDLVRAGASIESVPLADASVDAVLCSQVLSQVRHPERAISEIARVLRPGGRAILTVPHASPLHSEPYDLYRFTPDGLRALVEEAGLSVENICRQGGVFSSFALALAMNLVLSPPASGREPRLVAWRQVVFAPLIAFVNVSARALDALLPFKRMPTNFLLVAVKP